MSPTRCHIRFFIILLLGILEVPLHAGVFKLSEFKLSAPRDRRILFSAAATPSGDILTFVAGKNGVWHLYRVRDWLAGKVTEETLRLSGYFSKEDKSMLFLHSQLLITADGAYAVCVATATFGRRVKGRVEGQVKTDDIIAVVDLSTFTVVSTVGTSSLGLFDDFHDVRLDAAGRVLVNSLSNILLQGAFIQLSLPLLTSGPKCSYYVSRENDAQGRQHPEMPNSDDCRKDLRSTSIEEYLPKMYYVPPPGTAACAQNNSRFCRISGGQKYTADGKFGIGEISEGHDNIFGNFVTSYLSTVIFSVAERKDIGEVKLPKDHSAKTLLLITEGRDFLVIVRDGVLFTFYELRN